MLPSLSILLEAVAASELRRLLSFAQGDGALCTPSRVYHHACSSALYIPCLEIDLLPPFLARQTKESRNSR